MMLRLKEGFRELSKVIIACFLILSVCTLTFTDVIKVSADGGSSLWTPEALGDKLSLWLDAADEATFVKTGTSISQWNDKSGKGRNVTGISSPQYAANGLNNKAAVSLAAGMNRHFRYDDDSTNWADFKGNISLYTVANLTGYAGGDQADIISLTDKTTSLSQYRLGISGVSSIGYHFRRINDVGTSGTNMGTSSGLDQEFNKNVILGGTYDGSNIIAYQNGTAYAAASATGPIDNINALTIGARRYSNTIYQYAQGVIGEVIAVNTVLTTDERQKLEGYLAWKWGMQDSLPIEHPYKNEAPLVVTLDFSTVTDFNSFDSNITNGQDLIEPNIYSVYSNLSLTNKNSIYDALVNTSGLSWGDTNFVLKVFYEEVALQAIKDATSIATINEYIEYFDGFTEVNDYVGNYILENKSSVVSKSALRILYEEAALQAIRNATSIATINEYIEYFDGFTEVNDYVGNYILENKSSVVSKSALRLLYEEAALQAIKNATSIATVNEYLMYFDGVTDTNNYVGHYILENISSVVSKSSLLSLYDYIVTVKDTYNIDYTVGSKQSVELGSIGSTFPSNGWAVSGIGTSTIINGSEIPGGGNSILQAVKTTASQYFILARPTNSISSNYAIFNTSVYITSTNQIVNIYINDSTGLSTGRLLQVIFQNGTLNYREYAPSSGGVGVLQNFSPSYTYQAGKWYDVEIHIIKTGDSTAYNKARYFINKVELGLQEGHTGLRNHISNPMVEVMMMMDGSATNSIMYIGEKGVEVLTKNGITASKPQLSQTGQVFTINYDFSNDVLTSSNTSVNSSQYQWYISDSQDTGYTPIVSAEGKSYTVSPSDEARYIKAMLTPKLNLSSSKNLEIASNFLYSEPIKVITIDFSNVNNLESFDSMVNDPRYTGKSIALPIYTQYTTSVNKQGVYDYIVNSNVDWNNTNNVIQLFNEGVSLQVLKNADTRNAIKEYLVYFPSFTDSRDGVIDYIFNRRNSISAKLDLSKLYSMAVFNNTSTKGGMNEFVTNSLNNYIFADYYSKYTALSSNEQDTLHIYLIDNKSSISSVEDIYRYFKQGIDNINKKIGTSSSGVSIDRTTTKITQSSNSGGSGAGPIIPIPNSYDFADLKDVTWASEAISELKKANIISGISDTEFRPNDTITREQFTKLLVLAFGIYDKDANVSFNDVASDSWYYSYIASAYNKGITKGMDNDNFGVGSSMTREQMATMIYRASKIAGVNLPEVNEEVEFVDSNDINDYAKESVLVMQKAGIIRGVGDNTFAPMDIATRAQVSVVIYNLYNKIKNSNKN